MRIDTYYEIGGSKRNVVDILCLIGYFRRGSIAALFSVGRFVNVYHLPIEISVNGKYIPIYSTPYYEIDSDRKVLIRSDGSIGSLWLKLHCGAQFRLEIADGDTGGYLLLNGEYKVVEGPATLEGVSDRGFLIAIWRGGEYVSRASSIVLWEGCLASMYQWRISRFLTSSKMFPISISFFKDVVTIFHHAVSYVQRALRRIRIDHFGG